MNIHADEIVDGNTKLTLGLVWTIILHFQVCMHICKLYVLPLAGHLGRCNDFVCMYVPSGLATTRRCLVANSTWHVWQVTSRFYFAHGSGRSKIGSYLGPKGQRPRWLSIIHFNVCSSWWIWISYYWTSYCWGMKSDVIWPFFDLSVSRLLGDDIFIRRATNYEQLNLKTSVILLTRQSICLCVWLLYSWTTEGRTTRSRWM